MAFFTILRHFFAGNPVYFLPALTGGKPSGTYACPEEVTYSWWSYRFHAREKNAGWRIDYFIVSRRLLPRVTDAAIRTEVYGSDHCPVVLQLDTSSGQA